MKQVIYTSAATNAVSDEEFASTLERARAHNSAYGLSGILLRHKGCFLHVLEGADPFLNTVFAETQQSPILTAIRVLAVKTIANREYGHLPLAFIDTAHPHHVSARLLDFLKDKDLSLANLNESDARRCLRKLDPRPAQPMPPAYQSFLHCF